MNSDLTDPNTDVASTMSAPVELDCQRLERFLGFRLTRAKVRVHRLFQRELAALQLNATLYSVLALCHANPGCYQRQVGAVLDISAPNLVPVLDKLERSGWLARVPSAQDRRMQHLQLTPEGKELLERADAVVEDFERRLEAALSEQELHWGSAALDKLAEFGATGTSG